MSMLERVVPDEIRGVSGFHSRVHHGSEAELDRLHQTSGVRAPWMPGQEDEDEKEELRAVQIIRVFLHSLVQMTEKHRQIFFARLQGLEWQEIASAIIGEGCTAQAAQNEFRMTIRRFPVLEKAFQERQTNGQEQTT